MSTSEEVRMHKAKQMRYRRPACKTMHWDGILNDLYEMRDDIDEGRWMYGEQKVLSQMTLMAGLKSWAIFAVLSMSVIFRLGLAGVSR